jgi:hypothetical protein
MIEKPFRRATSPSTRNTNTAAVPQNVAISSPSCCSAPPPNSASYLTKHVSRILSRPSDDIVLHEVRRVSKALFGSWYRLEAGYTVAVGPAVLYARELAHRLGVGDNQAQGELRHFENAGFLERLDRVEGQRQQYYRRLDSPFWGFCQQLFEEIRAARAPFGAK